MDAVRATAAARKRPPPKRSLCGAVRFSYLTFAVLAIAIIASPIFYMLTEAQRSPLGVPAARTRAPTAHRAYAISTPGFAATYSALPVGPPRSWWERLLRPASATRRGDDGALLLMQDGVADDYNFGIGGDTRCTTAAYYYSMQQPCTCAAHPPWPPTDLRTGAAWRSWRRPSRVLARSASPTTASPRKPFGT